MASSSEYRRKLSTARAKEKLGLSIPDFSKMRFVLLGKNASENSQVGNFILGTDAFNSEAPPDEKIHHCTQRVGGILKKRHVTVIINSQLLQRNISDHQITETVRECVFLSDPGPHAFILVLQHNDFTEEDLRRVKHVLKEFSEDAIKDTIVLTTDEETHRAKVNEFIQQLTEECGGGHLQVKEKKKEKKKIRSQIFKRVENTLKSKYYLEAMKETPKIGLSEDTEDSGSDDSDPSEDENIDESQKEKKEERSTFSFPKISNPFSRREQSPDGNRPNMSMLNLVVCGSDGAFKSSISELILEQTDRRSEFVKKEKKIHDHLINLQELPALIGLSEEEVMRQTLRCVSLCHPGVHAFLFIIPVGPLTNNNKAEIEKIQKIFDSREHFVVLFTSDLSVEALATDFVKSNTECQRLISLYGGQHRVMGLKEPGNSRQIPELLDYIKNMKTEPYSLQMYVKAQENRVRHKLEEQHKEELKRKENEIEELQQRIQSEGTKEVMDDLKCLRIVLLGRTGSGKSATGNTILGREEFESELSPDSVTTVCMKGVGEVEGRSVAVVDTPGLFDNKVSSDHVVEEIMKCISLSSPGPHVFVIVLSLGRFTQEKMDTVDLIKKIFGHKAGQFSIVLFTGGDNLGSKSIEDYVKRSTNAEFKKLIRDCGDRFLVFNNREKQDKTQVIKLLNMIEEVKSQHRYFTNSMFEEAEMSIKKRMEEILKEKEREIQTQRDELQAKYETEMKNMKERLEEEKQRAEEERKLRENEFRQKKENLIKEFEEKEKKQQKKQETENHIRSEEEKQKRAEFDQKIEEMKREIESQRSQYEKQKEEDRKREEKYRQDQGKMKNEQERTIAELQMKQKEETKKRESEERKRIEQEEKQREEWRRKIKEAEHDRKETREDVKRQQREWEDEKKRQTREREEEERKIKEKHKKELKETQEELENMRKSFEREKEEERQKIEKERQKQKREREEKEREYEEKKQETERHYEQLERKRKEDWERKKREDDERREEERKRWERKIEDLKQEREEEIKSREKDEEKRKEREEKDKKEMKQKHDEEMKEMKKKHEDEARKQAEELNDFKERKEQHVQELQQMLEDHQKQQTLLEKLYQHLQTQKGEEIRELQKQVEEQKNKSGGCVIL